MHQHMQSTGVALASTVLAVLFAVDAVLTAGIVVFAPRTAPAAVGGRSAVDGGAASAMAVASVPHLTMDVAIVVMLAAV